MQIKFLANQQMKNPKNELKKRNMTGVDKETLILDDRIPNLNFLPSAEQYCPQKDFDKRMQFLRHDLIRHELSGALGERGL